MAMQNIGASNSNDAFYRYNMPKMVTKIEGRGNGIKTNVVNMVEIAKALGRPASYTTRYFGYELGAQSKFDEKTGASIVNGCHETCKLASLLENFIKKYVQCYGCGNPETEIVSSKKTRMIKLKCAACGFISDVDMRDKLATHILHDQLESKDKKSSRKAGKERLKGASKTTDKKRGSNSEKDRSPTRSQADEEGQDCDDVQWQTDASIEGAKQRIQEQLNAVTADMVMLSTAEEKAKDAKESPEGEVEKRD